MWDLLHFISHPPWYHLSCFCSEQFPSKPTKPSWSSFFYLFHQWSIHHRRHHGSWDIYLVPPSANYITSDAWREEKPWQIAQEKRLMCVCKKRHIKIVLRCVLKKHISLIKMYLDVHSVDIYLVCFKETYNPHKNCT